jgi:hypothetical protein
MHSYPTRFAHLNRSFFPTATMEVDPDYVPSSSVTTSGRRPVTRSMTRTTQSVAHATQSVAHATQRLALYETIDQILHYSSQVVARAQAHVRRPVTRSMTATRATRPVASNRHPMTLRSSRR